MHHRRIFKRSLERIFPLTNEHRIFYTEVCMLHATSHWHRHKARPTTTTLTGAGSGVLPHTEKEHVLTYWLKSSDKEKTRNDSIPQFGTRAQSNLHTRVHALYPPKQIAFAVKYSFFVIPYRILIEYSNIHFISFHHNSLIQTPPAQS